MSKSNSTLSPLLLNLALRKKLPKYMLPQAFVILLAMPLTPTGKIDRKALPDPAPSQRRSETQYVDPRNAVEASLAEIWSEALNLERAGIHDDFIDLGGNSLLAGQVLAKVNQVFGIDLSLRSLLDLSTLAGLAGAVAMLSASKGRSAGKPTDGRTEESGEL